jgi:hypothetical protein
MLEHVELVTLAEGAVRVAMAPRCFNRGNR